MALSGYSTYVFRPSIGQPPARIEQILYVNGLLLGLYHALPSLCLGLHHCQINPNRNERPHFQLDRSIQEPALLHTHCFTSIYLCPLDRHIHTFLRPMAYCYLRKSSLLLSKLLTFLIVLEQFLQYLLLTPTYINILNVYAFCNTHDVTWGTKGDDKAEKLPSANLKPGGKVDVNIPQDDADLNTQYETEMRLFANKPAKEKKVVSAAEHQEDYYKGFRSAVVIIWMFCNFALAAVVLSAGGLESVKIGKDSPTGPQRSTIYMAVVLWSVAGLSLFRFCGAVWFLIVRMVSHSVRSDTSRYGTLT